MAFETVHLFRRVEFDIDTAGEATFTLSTDQPGDEVASRHTATINTDLTTTGRRTVKVRLPGNVRGKLYKAKLAGAGILRIYGGRIEARAIGLAGNAAWQWHPMPIVGTPELYGAAGLPIAGTPEAWSAGGLPIPETPLVPRWVDLPVDAIE